VDKTLNVIYFIVYLILNPKLLPYALKGLYLPVFVQYRWLREYKIDAIIDVGAAVGNVSLAVGALFPNAKIFAFDPIEENCKELKKRDCHHRIIVEEVVISDNKGEVEFFINSYLPASSLLQFEDEFRNIFPVSDKIKVKTVTLDSYFSKVPLGKKIFLKIDTQGSELAVLQGAEKLLEKVSIVHIETNLSDYYLGQHLFGDIYDFLVELGFEYRGSIPDGQFFPKFNLNLQENSIFIKRNHAKAKS